MFNSLTAGTYGLFVNPNAVNLTFTYEGHEAAYTNDLKPSPLAGTSSSIPPPALAIKKPEQFRLFQMAWFRFLSPA